MLLMILPVIGFFCMLISITGFIYGSIMVHNWLNNNIPDYPLTEDSYIKIGTIMMLVTFILLIISICLIG